MNTLKHKLVSLWDAIVSPPSVESIRKRELAIAKIELLKAQENQEQSLANAEAYAAHVDMLVMRIRRLEGGQ